MLKLALVSPWNKAPIYYKAITGSTMEDAANLVSKKALAGTVVRAGFQKQGRGRLANRKWYAVPDKNLLFTLILNEQYYNNSKLLLPLLAGLAVAQVIEELFSISPEIKWPNDVLYMEKKIAGILCQNINQYYLIGIGINCNQQTFPEELYNTTCSLWQILKRDIDLNEFLIAILNRIKTVLQDSTWKQRLEQRLYHRHKPSTVLLEYGSRQKQINGIITGIGEQGELLLKDNHSNSIHKIVSGIILYG